MAKQSKKTKQPSELITHLQKQYHELEEAIEPKFQRLFEAYNKARDPLSAQFTASDLPNKLSILEAYHAKLTDEAGQSTFNLARVAFFINEKQRQLLVNELQQLRVNVPSNHAVDTLPILEAEIHTELLSAQQKEKLLQNVNRQFSHHLAIENATFEIEALHAKKRQVEIDSQKITEQIAKISADLQKMTEFAITTKEALPTPEAVTTAFDEAPNKMLLIAKLQAELTAQTSYLSLSAWSNWATQKKAFTGRIKAQTCALDLTQLLASNHDLNLKREALDAQLEKQKTILTSLEPRTFNGQIKLRTEILESLSLASTQDETLSDTQLFEKLSEQIASISREINRLEQALKLLNKMSNIEKTAFSIRIKFPEISSENTTTKNDSEIQQLEKSQNEQADIKKNIRDKMDACEECINSFNALQQLSKEIATQTEPSRPIKKSQKKRPQQALPEENKNPEPMPQEATSISNKLPEPTQSYPPAKEIIGQHPKLWGQLNEWNDKISALSKNLPKPLLTWYENLFTAISNTVLEEAPLLQSIQLLRDIHFELHNPGQSNNHSVLFEYLRQNRNPATSYMNLLNLKPAVPIDKNPQELPPVTDKTIQKKIKSLYQHHQLLERQFPKEAALLKQATLNYHQMTLNYENKKQMPQLLGPVILTQDPRYHCLEKHRGFGKVWEWLAQWCTDLINKIKSRPNGDYRHRFFFVPTQSSQLLNDTANQISERVMNRG